MIFITLGTQKFEFNRLLEKIDQLIEQNLIPDQVFAQIGFSTYTPKHYEYCNFLSQSEFDEKINSCSLLLTHGGVGAILTGLKYNKKIVALPRLKEFNEHIDDHQVEICEQFNKLGLILSSKEDKNLVDLINKSNTFIPNKYQLTDENQHIVNEIDDYLQSLLKK